MTPHMFIVLEGLSGSGKTTVGRIVADIIGGTFVSTPPNPLRDIRNDIDHELSHQARYFFYLAGVVHTSDQIREIIRNQSVVLDRYYLTTECFHKAIGVQARIDPTRLDLAIPDLTVVLTASWETLTKRLDHRGRSQLDFLEDKQVTMSLLEAYEEWDLPEIDTTTLSPEQVAFKILRLTSVVRRESLPEAIMEYEL